MEGQCLEGLPVWAQGRKSRLDRVMHTRCSNDSVSRVAGEEPLALYQKNHQLSVFPNQGMLAFFPIFLVFEGCINFCATLKNSKKWKKRPAFLGLGRLKVGGFFGRGQEVLLLPPG